jgi:DNA-binding transcriptional regulator YhcF (GntR family)
MADDFILTESMEDYLEMFYRIIEKQGYIRVSDLSTAIKVNPSSVTRMLQRLDNAGLISYQKYRNITMTDKGLTYGVWGGYFSNYFTGEFKISTFSKTASTSDAVKAILDEVKNLKTVPPTENEVNQSKSYIAGSFVINRETPQQIAEDLWLIKSQNLNEDYLDKLLYNVQNTTIEDCSNLVQKTLTPDKMLIVVVGDAASLKEPLEKIAPVKMITD